MKKETIIAIVFGLLLGSIVAFVLLFKNKETQMAKTKTIAPITHISPTIVQNLTASAASFTITEPVDGAIVDKDTIMIKGKAGKGTLIVIQSPIKDAALKVEKEDYSLSFPLALGENTIKLSAYPEDKKTQPQEKELKVYFMEEK